MIFEINLVQTQVPFHKVTVGQKSTHKVTCFCLFKNPPSFVHFRWKLLLVTVLLFRFSQRSDVEESPASVYETDEEESDTVSTVYIFQ